MDTSDSENFESADEEIQSDEEICVNVRNKYIEASSSCESKCEIIENKRESNKEGISVEKIDNEVMTEVRNKDVNKKVDSARSSQVADDHNIFSQAHNRTLKIDLEDNISKEVHFVQDNIEKDNIIGGNETKITDASSNVPKKNRSTGKFKLGTKICRNDVCFEDTPKRTVTKIVDKEGDQISVGAKDFSIAEKNQKVEEENLWNDEELDWSLEGCLETEKKISSCQSNRVTENVVQPPITETSSSNALCESSGDKTQVQSDSWGGWSSWGASVLSTATQSVSSITSQLTNVIESGIGAVDPEELAKINIEENKKLRDSLEDNLEENDNFSKEILAGFRLGSLVKLVENTGTKVISGGLDTLETIGKKTMEVLQDGDPGLKKKRAFLKIEQDKPVLSQILREAKEKAEDETDLSEDNCIRKAKNYETLFDDHHGLVHLEALELLSKQCELKLKSLQNGSVGDQYSEFIETMDQIKELCELPDEEDEEQISISEIKERLEKAVTEMNVQISYEKLVTNWEETEVWLSAFNLDVCGTNELHQQAIETLAQITSKAMEHFHKIGELLLIKDRRSTADEADSLVQITTTLTSLIGIVAAKFSEKLNAKVSQTKDRDSSGLITNVFFEAANSSSYIQDAFQLLIPVLQVGAL